MRVLRSKLAMHEPEIPIKCDHLAENRVCDYIQITQSPCSAPAGRELNYSVGGLRPIWLQKCLSRR